MKKKAIFLGSEKKNHNVYPEDVVLKLTEKLDFVKNARTFPKDELEAADTRDVAYIFSTWGMPVFTEEEIADLFPSLEGVFYAAGSVKAFAEPFQRRGVHVFSAWAANAVPVVEFTVAEITLANVGYYSSLHKQGGSEWENRKDFGAYHGNYGATVGIIGAGMIGKGVIRRLKNDFEKTKILVFDPFLDKKIAEELGVTLTDLETIFAECDVISNHLANNRETLGILNGDLFERMKPFATFINTGRGAQVKEKDLIRALKDVPTRQALLDVTFPEPPDPASELYLLPNVFLSPHIAGSTGDEVHRMAEYMYEEFVRVSEGKPALWEVTSEMLRTMA